jgi:putative hydrolase of the HAD superfamily
MFDTIAFDADDTLWHNEDLYLAIQERFARLLSTYQDDDVIQRQLYETEMRNLELFGYGIKAFTLSMIETAIELTGGQICGRDIQIIIDFAKEMRQEPVKLIDGVEQVIASLVATGYRLMLITKGDLFDQESKFARSGLAPYFEVVEIVSEESAETYTALLDRNRLTPERLLMVGNSLRSDILPLLAIGAQAVHIPYHTTWVHEVVEPPSEPPSGYHELAHIAHLPDLIARVSKQ